MTPGTPGIDELQRKLGYTFRDSGLLLKALTHKSYHFENIESSIGFNERLEFLGDSVIGLAVAGELFQRPERFDESQMSKIKSYVVKGEVISEVASDIGLGGYLLLGRGEEESGGRTKRSLLTNAMEAVIGAVYADSAFDDACALVLGLFASRILAAVESGQFNDYKSELQEECQERFSVLPEYRVAGEKGLEHDKTFSVEVLINGEVFGTGTGGSKKMAQQLAARSALASIRGG